MTDETTPSATPVAAAIDAMPALPLPAAEVVALAAAPAPVADAIRQRMAEIDVTNTQSIINFGSAAQGELTTVSAAMPASAKRRFAPQGPSGINRSV